MATTCSLATPAATSSRYCHEEARCCKYRRLGGCAPNRSTCTLKRSHVASTMIKYFIYELEPLLQSCNANVRRTGASRKRVGSSIKRITPVTAYDRTGRGRPLVHSSQTKYDTLVLIAAFINKANKRRRRDPSEGTATSITQKQVRIPGYRQKTPPKTNNYIRLLGPATVEKLSSYHRSYPEGENSLRTPWFVPSCHTPQASCLCHPQKHSMENRGTI